MEILSRWFDFKSLIKDLTLWWNFWEKNLMRLKTLRLNHGQSITSQKKIQRLRLMNDMSKTCRLKCCKVLILLLRNKPCMKKCKIISLIWKLRQVQKLLIRRRSKLLNYRRRSKNSPLRFNPSIIISITTLVFQSHKSKTWNETPTFWSLKRTNLMTNWWI